MTMDQIKLACDGASLCVAFAALAKVLPPVAALFSIVWTCIQVYTFFKNRGK